jgi:hypothetical protein
MLSFRVMQLRFKNRQRCGCVFLADPTVCCVQATPQTLCYISAVDNFSILELTLPSASSAVVRAPTIRAP